MYKMGKSHELAIDVTAVIIYMYIPTEPSGNQHFEGAVTFDKICL